MPSPQSDRRRAPRAAATFPVHLASPQGTPANAATEPALLRDISTIGLACNAPQPIEEMTLVKIDFSLPGQSERHNVQGAVVRCEPMRKAKQPTWDVAIYFTEISATTRAALHNYVARGKQV